MGFLDRAIKRGVSNAVGSAVERGVRQAIEPRIEQATANAVNSAANQINQAAGIQQPVQQQPVQQSAAVNPAAVNQATGTLGGMFGAVNVFANEAAKNMKICPSCGEGSGKDVKFCPSCGAKLPEETVAQSAVCPSCGKQNNVGMKFCADCGTKLPAAVAEEQAAQANDAAVMAQWDSELSAYPKWSCGGSAFSIEPFDWAIMFSAKFPTAFAAQNAVRQYRELLQQNGFRQAGEYPNVSHLYKMTSAGCCHCDTKHCFDGDQDCPSIYFNIEEPMGGFNYVKPEQKKPATLKDLFRL